ncbi:MAG: hypothetical protein ACREJ2_15310 [Planctomycetota bacterium]
MPPTSRNASAAPVSGKATPAAAAPVTPGADLDPDLAALTSWTVEMLTAEIQAQREHLAELADFLQILQDDNHVKDPALAQQMLESLKRMEQRMQRWETEFAGVVKK